MYRGNTKTNKTTFFGGQHGVRYVRSCFMSKAIFCFFGFLELAELVNRKFFIPDVPGRTGVVYDKGYRPENEQHDMTGWKK